MYPAEFGGKASALINVATKAGAQRVPRQPVRVPPQRRVRLAQLLPAGGPAAAAAAAEPVRRRARRAARARTGRFFFGSYEGQRMRRSLTRTFSVPTAAVRAGDFAGLGADLRSADDPDDRRLHAVRRTTRFPPSRIDPIAAAFLQHVPLPTSSAHAPEPDVGRGSRTRDLDQFSVRLDHRLDRRRPAVRALQHVRRRRAPAVRHQRAAGNARARIRPVADDADAEPGRPATRTSSATRC